MKLRDKVVDQLIGAREPSFKRGAVRAMIDDACELLTAEIVRWLGGLKRVVEEDLARAGLDVPPNPAFLARLEAKIELLGLLANMIEAE